MHNTKAARLQGKCCFEVQMCSVHMRTNIKQTPFVYIVNKHFYKRKRVPTSKSALHLSENIKFNLNFEASAKFSCVCRRHRHDPQIFGQMINKIFTCVKMWTRATFSTSFQFFVADLFVIRVFFTILRNNLPFVQANVKWNSFGILSNLQIEIEF